MNETFQCEICGLSKDGNGRSCDQHDVCGGQIALRSKVIFQNAQFSVSINYFS